MKKNFTKWPSIDGFPQVFKWFTGWRGYQESVGTPVSSTVNYIGKYKLHGTNSAIRVEADGTVFTQKRSETIFDYTKSDNAGFGWFVHEILNTRDLIEIAKALHVTVIVDGEWAGPGIQKGVAVSKIERKTFFIFAVRLEVSEDSIRTEMRPDVIKSMLYTFLRDNRDFVHVIPEAMRISLDFSSRDSIESELNRVNSLVDQIDECDPYIKKTFGIEGTGEGLVFFSTNRNVPFHMFKVKGEKHQVVKSEKRATIDPVVAAGKTQLVDTICPRARLEQGISEIFENEPVDMKKTKAYIDWVIRDIAKECSLEISESGFDLKAIHGDLSRRCALFLKEKMREFA